MVIPGDPDHSLLVKAVRYSEPQIKMPPAAKLSSEDIPFWRCGFEKVPCGVRRLLRQPVRSHLL